MDFKIGDRVKSSYESSSGLVGRVALVKPGGSIGVDFKESGFKGHNLSGRISTDTGYWVSRDHLTILLDMSKHINRLMKFSRRCHV